MKRHIAYLTLTTALAVAPLVFSTGCAVTQGRETAGSYTKDKEIEAKIKTSMYKDKTVKGTQVEVQSLNGVVQLSGFVDSQAAKDRGHRGRDLEGHEDLAPRRSQAPRELEQTGIDRPDPDHRRDRDREEHDERADHDLRREAGD